MNNEDDFFTDDILNSKKKKKKINSKDKGDRGERILCAVLCERFPDRDKFFRVVGSGARTSQVSIHQQAKEVLTSDIVCPPLFLWSIECKFGYDDIELTSAFDKGNANLDSFLAQIEKDATFVGKRPLLAWKKPHYPWLAFVKQADLTKPFEYSLIYRNWRAISLTNLLALPDEIFFGVVPV